jgi:NADPH:quinone reductase
MKAIRVSEYGGPSVLKLEEITTPQPAPNQVLVRNRAVGVNPVDTYLRSNTDNRGPKLPYTPGSDSAGVVEAVGGDVRGVKAGDRVYVGGTVSGAYAELSLCTEAQVHPLAPGASFAQGAAVNVPYATAYQALFNRARGVAGESVLVHGASGGVGIGAVQLARARGMTVIGTAGTERGRKLVAEQGAHHVLDHTAAGYLDEVLRLTGGRGVDVVMEMLANVNLQKDLGVIAMNGRIVVIGNRGTTEINARHAMNKNADILGMALGHATPAQLVGIHAALVEGLANGSLRPVIAVEIPLAEAARSHEVVMEAGHHGKVVLVP